MSASTGREALICMVGTDHALAPLDVRAAFSLTKEVRDAVLPLIRANLGASGVVMLATCNRTELWVSFDGVVPLRRSISSNGSPNADDPLFAALCAAHNVEPDKYAPYFACRQGDSAVSHLFHVACGLRSAIVAEDQIISQVKQAIATSRELGVADSCLEVLFRQAVTSAKQIKSGIRFTRAYATAVDQAIDTLKAQGVDLSRSTCLVIGNGEYGRLAASALVSQGASVLVTVRQYTHGAVVVPTGCTGVPYSDRYAYVDRCDVIMSATTSPHNTLTREAFEGVHDVSHLVALFDLAVPRDIDPSIADVPGCSLYDIDSFATKVGEENKQAIAAAQRIISSGMDEFWDWVSRRDAHSLEKPPVDAFFPLFVDLSEKKAVFIGGGAIALRRVRTLLPFVGDIVVYAPDFSPELERFAADGALSLVRASYTPSQLDDADMAFACTNSSEINDAVWEECKSRGIMVNVCSDRFKCDFQFPGISRCGNVVVGVNAGGKEHRRVKQVRARIDRLFEEEEL